MNNSTGRSEMRYHAVDASSELFFANQTPVLNAGSH
jgi:hypothetical protein